MSSRMLIAGIGNIFLGDDAFGVEVAAELSRRRLPEGMKVVDFGIRGLDLTYALLDEYRCVILVDATPRGGTPGELYVIEPDNCESDSAEVRADPLIDTHEMNPLKVLRLVRAMEERSITSCWLAANRRPSMTMKKWKAG